ncbi:Gfo/Idh/MocA family oxidoreductase [Cryobacterium frigoriphilum]|uniref:Gfo/Idh/MocA family oxidoreductase n=2 Tax=Cryobacterium frigoriphilum TaxID=1259150 RepID=A0A4R9AB49_9MICO|nr:Gfo/Idh/MocA family oxidoreductase [Cryobacterium frigoriphilum]
MGRTHARIIAREEQAELVGCADPVSDAAAHEFGVPHFSDHHALLAMTGLDAVIISNPNSFHVETALDCLAAGVPALLEKPVAINFAEARLLAAAAAASATPILVGHHRRHHPAVSAARSLIASGGLGRIVAVNGLWLTRKPDSYFEQRWHRSAGAGVMLINLVHDLDLLRHLCGEIVSIQASTSNALRGHEVEETASVIFEFENGALGSFLISDAAVSPWGWDQNTEDDPTYPFNPSVSCYSIAGTRGSLAFPQMAHFSHPGRADGIAADWTHPLSLSFDATGTGDSYTNQLRHFVAVVRGEAVPLVSVSDAAATLALIEAAQTAAVTGVAQRIPL